MSRARRGSSGGYNRPVAIPGHVPIVSGAPLTDPSRRGAVRRLTTMLRCSCGWPGGQVSCLSPGNGGGLTPARRAFSAHTAAVASGRPDRPVLAWWVTVADAIRDAEEVAS